MRKTLPTFLGIGATRAGTTWLYQNLSSHQNVWMPPEKELHFFDRSTKYPSPDKLAVTSPISRILKQRRPKGIRLILESLEKADWKRARWLIHRYLGFYDTEWYCNLFVQGKKHKQRGEITLAYSILDANDIKIIQEINPEIKIIFFIRNPIYQAWSNVKNNYKQNKTQLKDLAASNSDEIISYLQAPGNLLRRDYERTIDAYLKYFDSKQILVCFYDAILASPERLMKDITEFLEIDYFKPDTSRVNQSLNAEIPAKVIKFLLESCGPTIANLSKKFDSYATLWNQCELDAETILQNENVNQISPTLHP